MSPDLGVRPRRPDSRGQPASRDDCLIMAGVSQAAGLDVRHPGVILRAETSGCLVICRGHETRTVGSTQDPDTRLKGDEEDSIVMVTGQLKT